MVYVLITGINYISNTQIGWLVVSWRSNTKKHTLTHTNFHLSILEGWINPNSPQLNLPKDTWQTRQNKSHFCTFPLFCGKRANIIFRRLYNCLYSLYTGLVYGKWTMLRFYLFIIQFIFRLHVECGLSLSNTTFISIYLPTYAEAFWSRILSYYFWNRVSYFT